jgi:Rrf2 family transcriptional regulator, iron-sulfur cluster assembly transcription factor
MKLTTKTRYGTRLLLDIAQHQDQGAVQMSDISARQGISVKYLEQLIRPLKREKLITSTRGPKGGHILAQKPDKITLGQITRLFESQSDLVECISNPDSCTKTEDCVVRTAWKTATRALYEKLDAITISDLVCDAVSSQGNCT